MSARDKVVELFTGTEAGALNLAPGLNPHPDGSEAAHAWERDRIRTIVRRTIAHTVACPRCIWSGVAAQLLEGETCPQCKEPLP